MTNSLLKLTLEGKGPCDSLPREKGPQESAQKELTIPRELAPWNRANFRNFKLYLRPNMMG